MGRDENPERVNEMDSQSFEGFQTQLDCKLTKLTFSVWEFCYLQELAEGIRLQKQRLNLSCIWKDDAR